MEKIFFSYSQSQDAWRTRYPGTIPNYFECYRASEVDAERAAMLSDVRVLVEAAKPFAKLLQKHNDNGHHTKPIFAINDALLTLGDLRKIKQAIATVEPYLQK